MTTTIFPSEALILGLCVGEFLPAGEPRGGFLHILRNRLLPIIPSLNSMGTKQGQSRPAYDFSRSLFDVILDDLRQSVSHSKTEQDVGFSEHLDVLEHYLQEHDAVLDWVEQVSGEQQPERAGLADLFRRTGEEAPRAIETYLSSLAKQNGFEDLFELGRAFGVIVPSLGSARYWLLEWLREPPDPAQDALTFRLAAFLADSNLAALSERLVEFSLAKDMVIRIRRHLELKFELYPGSYESACYLVADMSAALWQGFGVVLGEVRERDEFALREEKKRLIPRGLLLGGEVTDDRIAEAVRNAQDAVRIQRGTPAVVVSQLAFAVETCIKRVLRKDLAFPNATILSAIEKHRRSPDDRMKKFTGIAHALREVYRHDATHESDELEVSWAEATFFVTGVQLLHELSKVLKPS